MAGMTSSPPEQLPAVCVCEQSVGAIPEPIKGREEEWKRNLYSMISRGKRNILYVIKMPVPLSFSLCSL